MLRQTKLFWELGGRLSYHAPHGQGPRKGSRSGPCDKYANQGSKLNILQINISGFTTKSVELMKVLSDEQIDVALVEETILPNELKANGSKGGTLATTGYTSYQCKCAKCQGILTLIRNDINAEVQYKPAGDVDHQVINVWKGKSKYLIHHLYCPPGSTSILPLNETIYRKCIIAGDFNAHSPHLGYNAWNNRGREVEKLCLSSNLILQQDMDSEPTLLHKRHNTTSRPDLTFVSADILERTTTRVLDDIGSDHKPTLITISNIEKPITKRRTFWNFRKADWKQYTSTVDVGMSQIEINATSIDQTSSMIVSTIMNAAEKSIPRGSVKKFKPYWNQELETTVQERRKARKVIEKDPSAANKTNYNRLTAKVRYLTRTGKRRTWRDTCAKLDLNRQGHQAWKLLQNLEGSKRKENPKPFIDEGQKVTSGEKKATILNSFLAGVSKSTRRKNLDDAMWKLFKRKQKSLTANALPFKKEYTLQELNIAIRKAATRKAPGPDKVCNEMISHMGSLAKQKLLLFINRTWKEGKLPTSWRTARVTPILKKGKPAGLPQSYRPISLTSCLGKVAERMVNYRLYHWLEKCKIIDNTQAGFRKGCRTEDQLFRFVQSTIDGFQKEQNTTAVFIDLQQAYDRVWRKGLLMKMDKIGVHGKMLQWIHAFLTNRTIQTTVEGSTSSKRTLEEGLPQGSALSCTLFLIFINDLPSLLNVNKALFADDLVIWTTEKYSILARAKLRRALGTITAYCNFWKLKINASKSVYSIFTKSNKTAKQELPFTVDGSPIIKQENPVYLGVPLDRQLSMNPFMDSLKAKARKRIRLIKKLATTTWGANKGTLRQMYLGYVRSAMEYALPLQSIASKTAIKSLDSVQNQSLRLVCGGMRSTPTAACEIDARVEPLDLRREKAVLESVERYKRLDTDNPNRVMVNSWEPIRRIQQQSPLDVAHRLEEKHNLPEDRLPSKKFTTHEPWMDLKEATIKCSLLDPTINKNSLPTTLKTGALETIDAYPSSLIHGYTDGSAFKGTTFAGFGAFLKFPDGSDVEISDACGKSCSNYDAEIQGLISAIELLHQYFELGEKEPTNAVIFTDSKSTLEALEHPFDNPYSGIDSLAASIDNLLTSYDIQLTLQWIPGHSDLPGNDRADKLAKEGAGKEQPDIPSSYNTVRQILRNNLREEWLNRWSNGSTGRVMYREMSGPNPKDNINFQNRSIQSAIFQLRTGHSKLNFDLNRFDPCHHPHCRHCIHPYETITHVLFDCLGMRESRKLLLPHSPSIGNTLYGSRIQLEKTALFYLASLTS